MAIKVKYKGELISTKEFLKKIGKNKFDSEKDTEIAKDIEFLRIYEEEPAQSVTATQLDEFMRSCGFHRHKQSHRGKGLYFSVGGFDVTRDDAKNMYFAAVRMKNDAVIEEREEVRYEIMRGQHGHDEISIVKSLEESIEHRKGELK